MTLEQLLANYADSSAALLAANTTRASALAEFQSELAGLATALASGNQGAIETASGAVLTANTAWTSAEAGYASAIATFNASLGALLAGLAQPGSGSGGI